MKRKVLLFALLVFLSLALFARGNSQPATPTSGQLPFVEFDWYFHKDAQPDDAVVFEAANRYIQEKINARINFVTMPGWDDWETRYPIMLNSGGVNGISHYGFAVNYISSANNGAFLALDELLDRHASATKALFSNAVWDGMRVGGKIYGVPTLKDNSYIMGGMYNATMAERLGINMSNVKYKSPMELEPLLMEVVQKRNALWPEYANRPLGINFNLPVPYSFAVENLAANPYAVLNLPGLMEISGYDSETVFNLYDTPEFLRYAQTMARFAANGIIPRSDMAGWTGNSSDTAFFFWNTWGDVVIPEHFISNDIVTKQILPARTWSDTSNYHTAGQAISSRTRDPDRAMMAINLMSTDSYLATLMRFGIEGQHYLRDAGGKMVLEGSPRNSDPASFGYLHWYGAWLGNVTIVNAPESYGGPDNYFAKGLIDANNNASLGHIGFVFDQAPVQSYIAACNAVVREYINIYIGGYLPESEMAANVTEFRQKLRDNGVQRIIDEAQRQLNAWKAARR